MIKPKVSKWVQPYVGPFDADLAVSIARDLRKALYDDNKKVFKAVKVLSRTGEIKKYDILVKI